MKPILCLAHDRGDGPAAIERWAERRGVALDIRLGDAPLPANAHSHALVVLLGGRAGARDADPRLAQERAFAARAAAAGVPVLGLCLGAQLLAVEFGGDVIAGGAPEHGWQPITIEEPRFAAVFDQTPPLVFAWHNDAIVLPPGARRLATGARCPVQGFSLCAPAPIVALQFHLEADAAKIALFRRAGKRDGDTAADEAAALAAQGRALEWLLHQLLAAH